MVKGGEIVVTGTMRLGSAICQCSHFVMISSPTCGPKHAIFSLWPILLQRPYYLAYYPFTVYDQSMFYNLPSSYKFVSILYTCQINDWRSIWLELLTCFSQQHYDWPDLVKFVPEPQLQVRISLGTSFPTILLSTTKITMAHRTLKIMYVLGY